MRPRFWENPPCSVCPTKTAVVLDGIGYLDEYMAEKPEEFLEYSDWMGIPIQPYAISLDRFKSLLLEQAERLR